MLENLSMHSPRDRLTGISLTFHFFPQHASLISAPVAWEFKAKSEVPLPESPFLYLSYFPDCHASVASLPLISKKKINKSLRNLLLCHHLFRHSTFTLSRKESKHQRRRESSSPFVHKQLYLNSFQALSAICTPFCKTGQIHLPCAMFQRAASFPKSKGKKKNWREGFGEAEENITFQNLYMQESIASENFHLISSLKTW